MKLSGSMAMPKTKVITHPQTLAEKVNAGHAVRGIATKVNAAAKRPADTQTRSRMHTSSSRRKNRTSAKRDVSTRAFRKRDDDTI